MGGRDKNFLGFDAQKPRYYGNQIWEMGHALDTVLLYTLYFRNHVKMAIESGDVSIMTTLPNEKIDTGHSCSKFVIFSFST